MKVSLLRNFGRRLRQFRAQRLTARWGYGLCLAFAVALCLLQASALGSYLEANINLPFHFAVRQWLHQDPELDPRLKILSYDDTTVDKLQRADLTIDDWASVLTAIASAKPRLIVIDKIFSIIFDPLNQKEQSLAALKAIDVPIVVGAFAIESELRTRNPLDLAEDDYRVGPRLSANHNKRPDFTTFRNWRVYGPQPEIKSSIRGAGHLLYYGDGMVTAFLQPAPDAMVPHVALLTERQTFIDGDLYINGLKLPLDARGRLVANLSTEATYRGRHKHFGTAVLAAREHKPIPNIEAGDTVVILPEMFTGSTDYKSTPIGILPAGFVLVSMVNSVLTSKWLGPLPGAAFQVFLCVLLGAYWGRRKSLRFWLGQGGLTLGLVICGVYMFSYRSYAPPTLTHVAAFLGSSLIIFAERSQRREREAKRVAAELNDAAEMATAFRPDPIPNWKVCDIAAYHKPYSEASGDWFAFKRSASGRFHHFVLCDVTGHGVQAALMVSICKTVLAFYRDRADALESGDFLIKYARILNEMLFYHGQGHHLVTMLGLTFDSEQSECHFLSAGHPAPLFFRQDGTGAKTVRSISLRASMLGLTEKFHGKNHVEKFTAGDEIIAYTDGLPVSRQMRQITKFIDQQRPDFQAGPKELLDQLWKRETKRTGQKLDDDISIVWFRMREVLAAKAAESPKASA